MNLLAPIAVCKFFVRRRSNKTFDVTQRIVVSRTKDFRDRDLAHGLNLSQLAKAVSRNLLLAQERNCLRADTIKHVALATDLCDINIERSSNLFFIGTLLDRPQDHEVLLNRREAI